MDESEQGCSQSLSTSSLTDLSLKPIVMLKRIDLQRSLFVFSSTHSDGMLCIRVVQLYW